MAILVAQATQDTTYLLGTSDAKDTFFGSSQAETLRYSGTGHLEWMDVTTGDRVHLNDASTGWQAKAAGNDVTLRHNGRTITLKALKADDTVTVGWRAVWLRDLIGRQANGIGRC